MINKMKNEIRKFVDTRVRLIKNQQRLNEQVSFNYNQLCQLFKEESFIPFSAWAISPSTILHVLNDIVINKRRNIVEFGSGASTFYIAKLLKVLQINAVFYSIESDEEWFLQMRKQIEISQLEEYVTIFHAPQTLVSENLKLQGQKTWYDVEVLKTKLNENNIDLILVDGPFGGSTKFARYSAIPFLKSKLAKDYSVFLDDVNRADEQEIAKEWENILKCKARYIERYAVFCTSKSFDVAPFQMQSLPI